MPENHPSSTNMLPHNNFSWLVDLVNVYIKIIIDNIPGSGNKYISKQNNIKEASAELPTCGNKGLYMQK